MGVFPLWIRVGNISFKRGGVIGPAARLFSKTILLPLRAGGSCLPLSGFIRPWRGGLLKEGGVLLGLRPGRFRCAAAVG